MNRSSAVVLDGGQAYTKPLKHEGNGEFGGNGKKMAVAGTQDLGFGKQSEIELRSELRKSNDE